ncbi:DUF7064 domain-containing protein [Patulibacter defluvii]|uniref:DUF7064 domain-containing protein n=1 Tax=Patulibacter defluvii TaxID=3095358 RepID=UPI002A763E3D|nr:tyrosine protein kinase [Patulibacter sp. DM4]
MPHAIQPPETDLLLPRPAGDAVWDPHTIHTHYFGFAVPEARIGAFLYVRYQPAFPLSQGGVCLFRGTDNVAPIDIDFLDYQMTMPWPEVDGTTITTANGLRIAFLEPGRQARVTYASADGRTSIDVTQTAVSPLLARGHVVPGEEAHHASTKLEPGGSEQFMHCVGELVLDGERFAVDSYYPRDRSWSQVRTEVQGGQAPIPPVGWSPMCFGEDLIFNQISFESPDADPAWAGHFQIPDGAPTHHFAWVVLDGEVREITHVRREVLEYHPESFMAMRQLVEARDEQGAEYRFSGEAIAAATLPAWPNASFHDSVYRWEDDQGRIAHCTYQELWADRYQRAMKRRFRPVAA